MLNRVELIGVLVDYPTFGTKNDELVSVDFNLKIGKEVVNVTDNKPDRVGFIKTYFKKGKTVRIIGSLHSDYVDVLGEKIVVYRFELDGLDDLRPIKK